MNTDDTKLQTSHQTFSFASFLAGTLVGLSVGALTALLTAPQPGEKTRAELQHGMEQFRDRTTETVKDKVALVKSKANQIKAEVQTKAGTLQHQGKGLIIKQLDRVSELADAGKKAIQETSDDHVVV